MICKAIVESIQNDYRIKVRIPSLHKGVESVGCTPSIDIPVATLCVSPGVYPALKVNDVVFVNFEDDDVDKPVIIGVLFSANCKNIRSDIICNSLKVNVNAVLPKDTKIGDVTAQNISHLSGLTSNAQQQLNNNKKSIEDIQKNGCNTVIQILERLDQALVELVK